MKRLTFLLLTAISSLQAMENVAEDITQQLPGEIKSEIVRFSSEKQLVPVGLISRSWKKVVDDVCKAKIQKELPDIYDTHKNELEVNWTRLYRYHQPLEIMYFMPRQNTKGHTYDDFGLVKLKLFLKDGKILSSKEEIFNSSQSELKPDVFMRIMHSNTDLEPGERLSFSEYGYKEGLVKLPKIRRTTEPLIMLSFLKKGYLERQYISGESAPSFKTVNTKRVPLGENKIYLIASREGAPSKIRYGIGSDVKKVEEAYKDSPQN